MGDNEKKIIRVLVVEDSPLMSKVLTNILNSDPQILVAGVAHNGKEAVEIVPKLKPDIITMDIHMPVMDGFEATRQIMAYDPTPILIVSTSVFKSGMNKVFEAISYGALDVIEKGEMDFTKDSPDGKKLIEKVKFLSGIKVITHPRAKIEGRRKKISIDLPREHVLDKLVAIVSSTGGPEALLRILRRFPREFPSGIAIVQHITPGFVEGLAEWLDSECNIKVKVGEDKEKIQAGIAYIAPCGYHMKVGSDGKLILSTEAPLDGHKPSGNLLLESVGRHYDRGAIGVILTGMGKDGAMGMQVIKDKHGQTIAQNEKTSVVFGMPKVAIDMEIIDKVLPIDEIAEEIVRMLG